MRRFKIARSFEDDGVTPFRFKDDEGTECGPWYVQTPETYGILHNHGEIRFSAMQIVRGICRGTGWYPTRAKARESVRRYRATEYKPPKIRIDKESFGPHKNKWFACFSENGLWYYILHDGTTGRITPRFNGYFKTRAEAREAVRKYKGDRA